MRWGKGSGEPSGGDRKDEREWTTAEGSKVKTASKPGLSAATEYWPQRGNRKLTSFPETLALAESGRKLVLTVEDWAEIRRLRRAEQMPIAEIARVMVDKLLHGPTRGHHKFTVASMISRRAGRRFSDLACGTGQLPDHHPCLRDSKSPGGRHARDHRDGLAGR